KIPPNAMTIFEISLPLSLRLLLCDTVNISTTVYDLHCIYAYDFFIWKEFCYFLKCQLIIFISILRNDHTVVRDQKIHIRSNTNVAIFTWHRSFYVIDLEIPIDRDILYWATKLMNF